jgi:hypothetical protein
MKMRLLVFFFLSNSYLLLPISQYGRSIKASDFGYSATDATTALRNAFAAVTDTLIIDKQPGDWITGPQSISNKSNYTIIIEPGVIIKARTGFIDGDKLLNFNSSNTNIKIIGYGATLQMLKSEYSSGEFRHCLQSAGVNGFEVYGLTCKDSGGDGLHIAPGGINQLIPSRNVVVKDCNMDNNRRQGISITGAENVLIDRCLLQNTSGTAPAAGIDIEPFRPEHVIKNVHIRNCRIINNQGYGIMIIMGETQTLENSVFIDKVLIENCDRGGIAIGDGFYGQEQGAGVQDIFLSDGTIEFKNCWIRNTKGPAVIATKPADSLLTSFKSCVFENTNNNTVNPVFFGRTETTAFFNDGTRVGPFLVSSYIYPGGSITSPGLLVGIQYGGLNFDNCLVVDDEPRSFMTTFGAAVNNGITYNQPLKNITGNILMINTNASNTTNLYNNLPALFQNVSIQKNQSAALTTVPVALTAPDNNASEEVNNYGLFNFQRSGSTAYPLPVSYAVSGTASSQNDYQYLPGFIVIPANNDAVSDTVIARNDGIIESVETVVATLQSLPAFYSIGSNSEATVNIGNNVVLGLPAKLIYFKATPVNEFRDSKVEWGVSAEKNINRYVIERSYSNDNFVSVKSLTAKNLLVGESRYAITDSGVNNNTRYWYRLKQEDNDGEIHYLGVIAAGNEKENGVKIYPNPSSGSEIGILTKDFSPAVSFTLTNSEGKQIIVRSSKFGNNYWLLQPTTTLANGVYYVRIKDKSKQAVYPVMVKK